MPNTLHSDPQLDACRGLFPTPQALATIPFSMILDDHEFFNGWVSCMCMDVHVTAAAVRARVGGDPCCNRGDGAPLWLLLAHRGVCNLGWPLLHVGNSSNNHGLADGPSRCCCISLMLVRRIGSQSAAVLASAVVRGLLEVGRK